MMILARAATWTVPFVLLLSAVTPAYSQTSRGILSLEELKSQYRRPLSVLFPAENALTKDREALGKLLFFDPRLSASRLISCATCHNPALSWGDGLPRAVGHGMKQLARRTPTILNVAWADALFWDGRAATLEEQALGPITSPDEMNLRADELVERLSRIPGYVTRFEIAYPGEGITPATVAKALATFERTVISGIAPFDEWIAGNEQAISEQAKRGFIIFNTKARCATCHRGWNFTDSAFHDVGVPTTDLGRAKLLPKLVHMRHAVKTPTLRNVDRRAPYMHNGSVDTLQDVIDLYDKGGVARPSRSPEIRVLELTAVEKTALTDFLKTLTSVDAPVSIPELPR
jgi:cytochrome c peroxidase